MSSEGPEFRTLEQNLARHRELRELIARIDRAFQRRTATIEEVSDMLADLGDRLVKHFAMEEDGGYFADMLLHAPQLVSKANALIAQHPKMTTQAKTLAAEIQGRGDSGEQWWQHTAALFRAFRDELLRHEKQENVLLQEAYGRDVGTTD